MSKNTNGSASDVAFACHDRPQSYFYEIAIRLGDHCEEIGGSRAFASPEDALMGAALALIGGGDEAEARFPAENDDHALTLRMLQSQGGVVGEDRLDRPCELIWSEVDPERGPIETRSLGIAPSTRQLVEAILAFGQARYAGRGPSPDLAALAAALS